MHPLAPHYNTLLRIDPTDTSGTTVVPDVAESWTISKDGQTYTAHAPERHQVPRRRRDDVARREGLLRQDRVPARGVCSYRKGAYRAVEAIEAPDPHTIRFRLKWPQASFLTNLASPYSWIYKADILARDIRWYEKNVMGTGPFKFVEHVQGSHWVGKKNPDYWDRGKPYLDGFRVLFIAASAAQVAAIARGARTSSSAASPPPNGTASSRRWDRRSRCRKAHGTACCSWR